MLFFYMFFEIKCLRRSFSKCCSIFNRGRGGAMNKNFRSPKVGFQFPFPPPPKKKSLICLPTPWTWFLNTTLAYVHSELNKELGISIWFWTEYVGTYVLMVFILNGSSEHVSHLFRKVGFLKMFQICGWCQSEEKP